MAHYGYADSRDLLRSLGYSVSLFTAENIDQLPYALGRPGTDALVLGSNALNDKTIRAFFSEPAFRDALHSFLNAGAGLLSFHQLRLAGMSDGAFSFLPGPLRNLRPLVRPTSETAASGDVVFPQSARDHVLLLYPNRLIAQELASAALDFQSLPGLYWHYWDAPPLADWDILAVDVAHESRPLVLATKETGPHRVVVSALTLDWQRQHQGLQNLLTYVVEGRHNTAVLTEHRSASPTFTYLLATLEARKFPFQRYYLDESLTPLTDYLETGVHTTLLVGDGVEIQDLPAEVYAVIRARTLDGHLKLLTIDERAEPIAAFSVASRETYAARLLSAAELAVQAELRSGNIDGSFWSTAESLQTLERIPETRGNYEGLVATSLALASEHERSGSYDEVFGATCAFYWMRARFLGAESEEAVRTERWIRAAVANYDLREKALAYTTFASLGRLTDDDRARLTQMLTGLRWENQSEIDLVTYLRAAATAELDQPIPQIVDALATKQAPNGSWIDLATTSGAAAALLAARELLSTSPALGTQVSVDADAVVRRAIIYIQDSLPATSIGSPFPWEGKASTSLSCLEAWLRFDTLVDLPVYEIADHLSGADAAARQASSGRTSLAVLEELKAENDRLGDLVASLQPAAQAGHRTLVVRRLLAVALCVVSYVLISVLVGVATADGAGLRAVLEAAFVQAVGVHLAVLGVVVTGAVVPWRRLWARLEEG